METQAIPCAIYQRKSSSREIFYDLYRTERRQQNKVKLQAPVPGKDSGRSFLLQALILASPTAPWELAGKSSVALRGTEVALGQQTPSNSSQKRGGRSPSSPPLLLSLRKLRALLGPADLGPEPRAGSGTKAVSALSTAVRRSS